MADAGLLAKALTEALVALDTGKSDGIYTSSGDDDRMTVDGSIHIPSLAADVLRRMDEAPLPVPCGPERQVGASCDRHR